MVKIVAIWKTRFLQHFLKLNQSQCALICAQVIV